MAEADRYLVDTSAWIDFLRGRETAPVHVIQSALQQGAFVALTPIVLQELLQGASDAAAFDRLSDYFSSQEMVLPNDPVRTHSEAAKIHYLCRRAGITIRSTIDCLIAQLAIEHELTLIHSDRDFELMREVAPELSLAGP